MNRIDWLKEKRRIAEERMDTLFAPIYDQEWGATIDPTHRRFIGKFLSLCPPQGLILDAACGTGKYWPVILDSGRTIFGVDQSQGMLNCAREKHPNISTQKIGLQELHYPEAFDGAICMDAMENVFPEDWLLVMENLWTSLKPGSFLYFTVELADPKMVENAFAAGQQLGLPVVFGEWAHEEGYHYYPKIKQVQEWLHLSGFRLAEETVGDEYHHFIVQK